MDGYDVHSGKTGTVAGSALGWTYVVTTDVNFGQLEEAITLRAGLHDLAQNQVHPVVACDEVAVQSFAILELHQHGVALCGRKKTEGELKVELALFLALVVARDCTIADCEMWWVGLFVGVCARCRLWNQ